MNHEVTRVFIAVADSFVSLYAAS